jgi:hypothetical protein
VTRNPLGPSHACPHHSPRGTNVNTTPQSTINGQNKRRNGGFSIKAKACFKGKLDSQRKDANASTIANRFVGLLRFNSGHFSFLSLHLQAHLLTLILQDAIHADYEGRSATKVHQPVPHANISDFGASTRDPCGGATMINDGSKKTTSK